MLYWVQPRRVLCIKNNVHFEGSAGFQYLRMSMYHCIIHKYYYVSLHKICILWYTLEHLIYKVLIYDCIYWSLNKLISYDSVLRYGWYQCHLIVLSVEILLRLLEFHRNQSHLSIIVLIILLSLFYYIRIIYSLLWEFDSW